MRFLILEDNAIIAHHIVSIAEQSGHEVGTITANAQTAVDRAMSERPDVLIADVDLGRGGDGIEAAVHIHQATGIKTIFITGCTDYVTRDRAQHAWPLGFLPKPFDQRMFEALLTNVKDMIHGCSIQPCRVIDLAD